MSGKILVTGGTGSFGKTMVRDLLARGTDEVRVLSRDETKQDDMRRAFGDGRLRFFLGDVRDIDSVREAARGVDNIFHAAALKQVPSCEFFPLQAVQTNVLGSSNVVNAAAAVGVKSVVFLSTDKAVYPINAMGISKAMMEKVAQAFARNNADSETTVSITRYGNVMYSRGSVIPVFVDQVKNNRPIQSPWFATPSTTPSPATCSSARRLLARLKYSRVPLRACSDTTILRSTSLAPATARSFSSPFSVARRGLAPKTWATTFAFPSMRGHLSTNSTSIRARAKPSKSRTTTHTTLTD